MKKRFIYAMAAALSLTALPACMDDHDEPDTTGVPTSVTSSADIGAVNSTIYEVKEKYCATADGADSKRNNNNWFSKVTDDIVIEGVVAADDAGGNLYQTLLIRNIDASKPAGDPARDQSIILGVKTTAIFPYIQRGQRVKVALKGLYAGVYSNVPRIGQPVLSSYGNLNLGPMLFDLLATHVQLVGKPDLSAPELTPNDLTGTAGESWLSAKANRSFKNTPQLASVRGLVVEALPANREKLEYGSSADVMGKAESLSKNGKKILAPYELHDDGYAVSRTIQLSGGGKVALRTSTKNDLSYVEIPENTRTYTGILTYYGSDPWQVQLRYLSDLSAE